MSDFSAFLAQNKVKQENIKFFAYGKSVEQAIQDAGLTVELCGPTPQVPSVAKGLELTLEKQA